jgi:hypothetical protein
MEFQTFPDFQTWTRGLRSGIPNPYGGAIPDLRPWPFGPEVWNSPPPRVPDFQTSDLTPF